MRTPVGSFTSNRQSLGTRRFVAFITSGISIKIGRLATTGVFPVLLIARGIHSVRLKIGIALRLKPGRLLRVDRLGLTISKTLGHAPIHRAAAITGTFTYDPVRSRQEWASIKSMSSSLALQKLKAFQECYTMSQMRRRAESRTVAGSARENGQ
jgi:hypothetical protein